MKVIVFDLDDTLYDEMTYVYSGFHAVAQALGKRFNQNSSTLFNLMVQTLKEFGRGRVFDTALESINKLNKTNVKYCVNVYRTHNPQLKLLEDAEFLLTYLEEKKYAIYIVTDGNKYVQSRKLEALGLYTRVKKCFVTHNYGVQNAKPSPHCFIKICNMEEVNPSEVVYIGDNIAKDFIGIKPLGFNTVRINRGSYKDLERPEAYLADVQVDNLTELVGVLGLET